MNESTFLLEHHLKALKLPTFLRDFKSVAAACAQDQSNYPSFLLRLVERELDRERRAAERRIRGAAFPVVKTLESFDFGSRPSINQALVRELAGSGEYIAKSENILLGATPAPAKPTWPAHRASPREARASGCALPPPRRCSPSCSKYGKHARSNGYKSSSNGSTC